MHAPTGIGRFDFDLLAPLRHKGKAMRTCPICDHEPPIQFEPFDMCPQCLTEFGCDDVWADPGRQIILPESHAHVRMRRWWQAWKGSGGRVGSFDWFKRRRETA